MYKLFALRYFKAKKSTNAINIISWVSVTAIAVGAAAMVLVLSVYNGFEDLVKSLYSSFYPEIKVAPVSGKTLFISDEQLKKIAATPGVAVYSKVAEEKAAVINGDYQTIVSIKGVDENYTKVTGVADKIIRGKFDLGTADEPLAILGSGVEGLLGVNSATSIYQLTTYIPRKAVESKDPRASLPQGNILPAGTFAIQQDFDNKYIITNLAFIKKQIGLQDDEYSAIEIKVKPEESISSIKKELISLLGNAYKVEDRYEQNRTLYNVMQLEKWVIFGILSLILIIAAFNMIGALTMLVLEKKKDIQVLQAMGADKSFIKKVLLSEGVLLASIGAFSGMLLAVIFCLLQQQFHFIPLAGNSFVIDYYPVKVLPLDLVVIALTIFIVAILASWIPATKASNQPFELKV
ncbi:MAG: ABC transporter permease [Sphingobacteriales bacterium]|nr:ABC transporter permease [Sphingobacteriales bacterium]